MLAPAVVLGEVPRTEEGVVLVVVAVLLAVAVAAVLVVVATVLVVEAAVLYWGYKK